MLRGFKRLSRLVLEAGRQLKCSCISIFSFLSRFSCYTTFFSYFTGIFIEGQANVIRSKNCDDVGYSAEQDSFSNTWYLNLDRVFPSGLRATPVTRSFSC